MKITALEIYNLAGCPHASLKFNDNSPVFLIHSPAKCEVITLATQLICTSKYDSFEKLLDIRDKAMGAQITMTFTLTWSSEESCRNEYVTDDDHSSDSDVPCTSRQAYERAKLRQECKRRKQMRSHTAVITACRELKLYPLRIEYTVNNGQKEECSINIFHKRFFACTHIIFPRLSDLESGSCCNGRWLDLLGTDFLYKEKERNYLIASYCELYSQGKFQLEHKMSKLTTAMLIGLNLLNQSRISNLMYIFQDIRCVFEYITCSEYTVWFLLPSANGSLQDITEITTNSISFELMRTEIQLKTMDHTTGRPCPKIPWTEVNGYVRELFLVAVQIAFGYHCGQNILFLHNLGKLSEHQSLEYIRSAYARRFGAGKQWIQNNYLQRIVNVCEKFDLTCVLEYHGGIAFEPKNAFIIKCVKPYRIFHWVISLKTSPKEEEGDTYANNANELLNTVKRRLRGRHIRFHPDTKYQ